MNDPAEIKELAPYLWEIPVGFIEGMSVPGRVYLDRQMLDAIGSDRSIEQLANVATLPGIERYAIAMPDVHQGYGFPVGGVAAIRAEDGVISPGGIGYDINCGVRLLTSGYRFDEVKPHIEKLATQIQRDVPSGMGQGGVFPVDPSEMDQVLTQGSQWAQQRGMTLAHDLDATEEYGRFAQADPTAVSDEAKRRGRNQLGTIGSGNHFVEIQRVAAIFCAETAGRFGLQEDQICVMIHTGSRGLGHQTCTDYVRLMNEVMGRYRISIPDRELACAPFRSPEGQRYFSAMAAAANFAWANRQVISHQVREAFVRIMGYQRGYELELLYDVSHNIAKLERYDGQELVVHRKGATRAFGPDSDELPDRFRLTGQPVLIPGSMGTSSYVLSGTTAAMRETFGSCCHGAGRAMSRSRAKRSLDYNTLLQQLEQQGVTVRGGSAQGLLEEAPQAYKDVDAVIRVVQAAGIAKPVAKLLPVAVIKG